MKVTSEAKITATQPSPAIRRPGQQKSRFLAIEGSAAIGGKLAGEDGTGKEREEEERDGTETQRMDHGCDAAAIMMCEVA